MRPYRGRTPELIRSTALRVVSASRSTSLRGWPVAAAGPSAAG